MIRYRIPLSKLFPSHHPRKGEPTEFSDKYLKLLKLHTIRANYDYWKKRIDRINQGGACLEVYEWTGKPYCSPAKTIFTITEGLSYQAIDIRFKTIKKSKKAFIKVDGLPLIGCLETTIMQNDGLSEVDFCNWFKKDLIGGIIIHFSKIKY